MKIASRVLVVIGALLLLVALPFFVEARSLVTNLEVSTMLGDVVLVNAEWVVLTVVAALCGLTGLVLAYLGRSVDVLASVTTETVSRRQLPTR